MSKLLLGAKVTEEGIITAREHQKKLQGGIGGGGGGGDPAAAAAAAAAASQGGACAPLLHQALMHSQRLPPSLDALPSAASSFMPLDVLMTPHLTVEELGDMLGFLESPLE